MIQKINAEGLSAGLMMDMFQLRYAFSFGALIMILGTGLFFFYTYHRKEKPLNDT
ncbi:MAG: hypothetical protein KKG97_07895 [Proteobacteria bacterium]|nr:hypothetical protein [Pseudomonadota bacterium]